MFVQLAQSIAGAYAHTIIGGWSGSLLVGDSAIGDAPVNPSILTVRKASAAAGGRAEDGPHTSDAPSATGVGNDTINGEAGA